MRNTYDGGRDVAVERPPWLWRILAVLVLELLLEVYKKVSAWRCKAARGDVQCASTFASFWRSPKLGRYFRTGTPLRIFFSSKSNLFRNTARAAGGQRRSTGSEGRIRTDEDAVCEELGLDDGLPKEEGVLEAVYAAVFLEELVEAGDGREEEDRARVVEIWEPRRPLSPPVS